MLVNTTFLSAYGDARVMHLSCTSSDHCPMVTSLMCVSRKGVRPFHFQRMWGTHEDFLQVVKRCWMEPVECCAMVRLTKKLKALKKVLQKWNVEVFGRVEYEIKNLEARLFELEDSLLPNYSQEVEQELLGCK